MPDIDVFAGADELALHPGQPITGASLPTREEYEFWLEEQQGIEREMEYFDKGAVIGQCTSSALANKEPQETSTA